MTASIEAGRAAVRRELTTYLAGVTGEIGSISGWTDDVIARLGDYAGRGKLIRGALVPFGESLFRGSHTPGSVDLGVAMELLQTFLLIHDDIMDDDDVRRGGPAVHVQFREESPDGRVNERYGISQGICVGDVAAFLALHRIATAQLDPPVRDSVHRIVGIEIVRVGLAQMQDVYHGWSPEASVESILDVYTFKTGRYTFSLPLMLGAIVAGQPEETIAHLSELGEALGRIFQIRDDELGLYGDEEDTGKPSGSDVRENKKTLLRTMFDLHCSESASYGHLFGKRDISAAELQQLRDHFDTCGARGAAEEIVQREASRCRDIIDAMSLSDEARGELLGVLSFNLSRTT